MGTNKALRETDGELESWLEKGLPVVCAGNYGFWGYIRTSGLSNHYQKWFDPFQLQAALEAAAQAVPSEAPIMVEFDVDRGFKSRIYAVTGSVDGQALKKEWRRLRLTAHSITGFSGIPKGEDLEALKAPMARNTLNKGLFLLCATCTYRAFEHWPSPVFISISGRPMAAKVI